MGNVGKSGNYPASILEKSYSLVSNEKDPRLGNIRVYRRNHDSELFWVKETYLDSVAFQDKIQLYLSQGRHLNSLFITEAVYYVPNESYSCSGYNNGSYLLCILAAHEKELELEITKRAFAKVILYLSTNIRRRNSPSPKFGIYSIRLSKLKNTI